MRRTLSLLVVLMMTLGPFAQGVDLEDVPSLTPPEEMGLEIPSIQPPPEATQPSPGGWYSAWPTPGWS